jgi:hypothetical protein
MEAFDKEVELALMRGEDPAEHVAGLTRVPQEPVRLAPEQKECPHPLETISFNAYQQVLICRKCGAEILIEDFPS